MEMVQEQGRHIKIEEDRISELPSCLIIEILSRLPSTKNAITTSVLSKRWQYLWTSVPNLSFYKTGIDFYSFSKFDSIVHETLTQLCHRELNKLDSFKIYTDYDPQYESSFKNWIRFAINRNVQRISLLLYGPYPFVLKDEPELLFFNNSCLTHLAIAGCVFNPIGAISWKNIRSLIIICVKLEENIIQNILSGSPQLETLKLKYCYGFRKLDITSKSVKNVVFSGYVSVVFSRYSTPTKTYYPDMIEINAPYVLSLTIKGRLFMRELILLDVSSLRKIELDYYDRHSLDDAFEEEAREKMLKGFLLKCRHVKEFNIGFGCPEVLSALMAKGFIYPPDMKFPEYLKSDFRY